MRGNPKRQRRRGIRNFAAATQLGEYLEGPLKPLAGVGGKSNHITTGKANIMEEKVREVLGAHLDVLVVVVDGVRELFPLTVVREPLRLKHQDTSLFE